MSLTVSAALPACHEVEVQLSLDVTECKCGCILRSLNAIVTQLRLLGVNVTLH